MMKEHSEVLCKTLNKSYHFFMFLNNNNNNILFLTAVEFSWVPCAGSRLQRYDTFQMLSVDSSRFLSGS